MPNMIKYQTEDFPKNLSIDISAKHSFKNFEKINNWYEKELEFHQKIGNPANITHNFTHQVKNPINSKFSQNRNDNFTIDELLTELKTISKLLLKHKV
jgi:hypothetical protein